MDDAGARVASPNGATRASTRVARWIVPSLGSILALTALANALFLRGPGMFSADGDVGRHIRVGRTILELGAIPRSGLFSHTMAGTSFIPYEWLSEVITAGVDGLFGLPGVAVLSALLYLVAALGIFRTSDELGAPRLLALPAALLGLLLMSVHLLPRPHLFTTALASVFMIVLLDFARTGRPWHLAPLPLLMMFWANAHGGFLIGFILMLAFAIGAMLDSPEFANGRQAAKPLLLLLVVCVLATLLNPSGLGLWRHTTGYLGIDFLVARTQEYRSVDFHEGYGKIFFVALFAGPVLWTTGRVRVSALAAGLYLFFAASALHSARNIPLFCVAAREARATGPSVLRRLRDFERTDRQLHPGLSTVAAGALVWFALGPWAPRYRFDPQAFPVAALSSSTGLDVSGPVFNQMTWGGYILYARPDIPVFIDGQTDFYGEELSREYLTVLEGRAGWHDVLDRYHVQWTLTFRAEAINQLLDLDPEWRRAYEDDVAITYRRVIGGRESEDQEAAIPAASSSRR
jgi:hypothetical protein